MSHPTNEKDLGNSSLGSKGSDAATAGSNGTGNQQTGGTPMIDLLNEAQGTSLVDDGRSVAPPPPPPTSTKPTLPSPTSPTTPTASAPAYSSASTTANAQPITEESQHLQQLEEERQEALAHGRTHIQTQTQNQPEDPLMGDLKMMFPTVDGGVIMAVIESHEHENLSEDDKLDKCIGDLLQMTDPSYKPEPQHNSSNPSHNPSSTPSSQTELDEALARSLQFQDDQSARDTEIRGAFQRPQGQNQGTGTGSGNLPYQPRVKRGGAGAAAQGGLWSTRPTQGGGTGMASGAGGGGGDPFGSGSYEARTAANQGGGQYEQGYNYRGGGGGLGGGGSAGGGTAAYEQKFEQFAELGKQKFGSFLSKAKSKVNDFQTLQQQRQATGQQPQTFTGTLGSMWSDATAVAGVQKREDGVASGRGGGYDGARGGREGQQSPTMQQAQQASKRWQPGEDYGGYTPQSHKLDIYQPSTTTSSSDSLPLPEDSALLTPTPRGGNSTVKPYDIGGSSGGSGSGSGSGASYPGGSLNDRSGTSPGNGKIDAAKLGMLPKRRVSLLSTSPNATTSAAPTATPLHQRIPQRTAGQDEDDEFTKNPFDE